jgi:hypothetical protein
MLMSEEKALTESAVEVRMQIIRADGTVQDMGLVSASYRNPVRQFVWQRVLKPLADRRIKLTNQRIEKES